MLLQPNDVDSSQRWNDFVFAWEEGIAQNPILGATVVGAVLGFLSTYIVMRRMVFVSAAITQAAALGVALAFFAPVAIGAAIDPTYGGVALALLASTLLVTEPRRAGVSREMILGMVYAVSGGATILISLHIPQKSHDIDSVLFGPSVLVAEVDLHRVLVAGAMIMVLQLWWFRGLAFASFDPIAARAQRLPVRLLNLVLLLSIGVMIGVSARAVGAMPVFAFSTMPAIAALQIGARGPLLLTFLVASVIGAASGAGGYIVAFLDNTNVGAWQTVLAVLSAAVAVFGRLAVGMVRRLL